MGSVLCPRHGRGHDGPLACSHVSETIRSARPLGSALSFRIDVEGVLVEAVACSKCAALHSVSAGTTADWREDVPELAPACAECFRAGVDPAGLPALLDAIRHLEGCDATWVESVPVHETHEDKTVWDGEVQVFDLVKHPKTKRAYAWSHATEGARRRFHVVLHLPPVDGPAMAVRTAVLSEYRSSN